MSGLIAVNPPKGFYERALLTVPVGSGLATPYRLGGREPGLDTPQTRQRFAPAIRHKHESWANNPHGLPAWLLGPPWGSSGRCPTAPH